MSLFMNMYSRQLYKTVSFDQGTEKGVHEVQAEKIPLILLPWLTLSFQGTQTLQSTNSPPPLDTSLSSRMYHMWTMGWPVSFLSTTTRKKRSSKRLVWSGEELALPPSRWLDREWLILLSGPEMNCCWYTCISCTFCQFCGKKKRSEECLSFLWAVQLLPYSTLYIFILYSFLHHMDSFTGYLAKLHHTCMLVDKGLYTSASNYRLMCKKNCTYHWYESFICKHWRLSLAYMYQNLLF